MSDDNDDTRDAALHHTSEAAREYDDGEEFIVREWREEAEGAKEPYPDDIEETTCGWPDEDVEAEYEEGGLEEARNPIPEDINDETE